MRVAPPLLLPLARLLRAPRPRLARRRAALLRLRLATPVLNGLGSDASKQLREFAVSTAVCFVAAVVGLQHWVPHPQHDPVVVECTIVALFAATLVKVVAFFWCFYPAMTGLYPVVGVSLTQWCDCLNSREDAEEMETKTAQKRAEFLAAQQGAKEAGRESHRGGRRNAPAYAPAQARGSAGTPGLGQRPGLQRSGTVASGIHFQRPSMH